MTYTRQTRRISDRERVVEGKRRLPGRDRGQGGGGARSGRTHIQNILLPVPYDPKVLRSGYSDASLIVRRELDGVAVELRLVEHSSAMRLAEGRDHSPSVAHALCRASRAWLTLPPDRASHRTSVTEASKKSPQSQDSKYQSTRGAREGKRPRERGEEAEEKEGKL